MSSKTTTRLFIALIGLAFLLGLALYARMPDPMPSHWNAAGEVDGYMAKFWGLFLFPLILVGIFILYFAIPRIDPLRGNIAAFAREYNLMMALLAGFMFYVYVLTLAWALGLQFDMNLMLLPALGALLIAIGYLIGKAHRNFFVGIRTPWTLTSDTIWVRTHRLGKWLFIAAGIVSILAAFLGEAAFWVFLVVTLLAAFVPIVYSFILWKQENPE